MNDDVRILAGGEVAGTFPYVDFPKFSNTKAEQEGHYLWLKLGSAYQGKNVTVQRISGTKGKAKTVQDLEWVLRLTDGKETVFTIQADEVEPLQLSFARATLQDKG